MIRRRPRRRTSHVRQDTDGGVNELQAFIGAMGAAPVPPELTVAEAVASPDQY
jgi:hypothetical protein